uniref:PAP-associated domain-containing protein n=1 Tax=Panagrolaimus davidi TaxID=227884 RepID=A0A914PLP2_9BILA
MSEIWLNDDENDDDAFELPELKDFVPEKADSDTTKLAALEERLQTNSPLNSRSSPAIDERIFRIGPAFHECGSFLNFSINENTNEIQSVWFFFGLAIFICDEKRNETQNINELLLQLWIKKIQLKLHESGIAQQSDIVIKTNSFKLVFEHKNIPAKITLLFNASEALKRSQLIRLYTRLCPNMIKIGYLYNNLILTNPELHEFTNASLCYLIIHFLQQTERIGILHPSLLQSSSDLKINENLSNPSPKISTDSVAFLCYGFAKFYAAFNFEIFIIDIGKKELCFWTETDQSKKDAVGIRCSFSGKNLGKSISSKCLEKFVQKMKEIVVAFENGKEAEAFPADIEEFAKKPLPPKPKK